MPWATYTSQLNKLPAWATLACRNVGEARRFLYYRLRQDTKILSLKKFCLSKEVFVSLKRSHANPAPQQPLPSCNVKSGRKKSMKTLRKVVQVPSISLQACLKRSLIRNKTGRCAFSR
ncbi:unnamed protein product [Amoebophrya sp. A25]|nr:unnamed protein product [Amoebophrya sp. A25]|eukprot:GSA25T00002155001.1